MSNKCFLLIEKISRMTASLISTLDDLELEDFERFKFYLNRPPNDTFKCISKAHLSEKSRTAIADTMLNVYGDAQALTVTIQILKEMNKEELANQMEKWVQRKRPKYNSNGPPAKSPRVDLSPRRASQQTPENATVQGKDVQTVMAEHKQWLKSKNQYIVEETAKGKQEIPLNEIYTDLIITQEGSAEHKVLNNENSQSLNISITFNDLFEENKTILTKGVGGIGKTVSVQKFIIDWAENKAGNDIMFLFLLPFRELNLIKDKKYSLHELLVRLHPKLKGCNSKLYTDKTVMLIFDGLEESRIPLDFKNLTDVSDMNTRTTVESLTVNLLKRELLPSATFWITSRPAAANLIPSEHIDLVTEIQGFSTLQKEQYFIKKLGSEDQAKKIISYNKEVGSLHIMCQSPVFCWISVTALQPWLTGKSKEAIPTTLTEMYSHFLLVQINRKNKKFDERREDDSKILLESNRKVILKLAELAFKQQMKCNVMFRESDLNSCGIPVQEASLYSGFCTEIFKQESVFYRTKVYIFVHPSLQEFFAALYVFDCYQCRNMEELKLFFPTARVRAELSLDVLMNDAVNEALKSKNGHLDLFLRFLHGMSLESSQKLLHGLLTRTECNNESITKMSRNLKQMQKNNINPERWMNLANCLIEMKDDTLHQEIEIYRRSKKGLKKLSPAHCSALANMFQMSEQVMEELNLRDFNTTEEGYRRLLPALRNCKKANLADCDLSEQSCEDITTALPSANAHLREIDLSNNDLYDSGLNKLFDWLRSSRCKLEKLSLSSCMLTKKSCKRISSGVSSESLSLIYLDLSYNDLQTDGLKRLSPWLKSPHCKLDTLSLSNCKLTVDSCKIIPQILQKPKSLKVLNLSCNDLKDEGFKYLSDGLMNSHCRLEVLRLSACKLTEQSCNNITSFLLKPNSSLRELDLSDNDLEDSGVKVLCDALSKPECTLEVLSLAGCCLKNSNKSLVLALRSNPSYLEKLDLRYNHLDQVGMNHLRLMSSAPNFKLTDLKKNNRKYTGVLRIAPGPRKYACNMTLDPKTAHARLSLSEDKTKVSFLQQDQEHQINKRRFQRVAQVLCKEYLFDRCYWEVEWHRGGIIAVTYKSIRRKTDKMDSVFGRSKNSWSLELSANNWSVWHNNKIRRNGFFNVPLTNRVGVHVDRSAGTLSFYSVSTETQSLTLMHTFHTTFTDRLFAGFGFQETNSSVSLIKF